MLGLPADDSHLHPDILNEKEEGVSKVGEKEGEQDMKLTAEERKAYQKHYRETHREERRAYTEKNRERINALRRLDYQLNREKLREQARRYYLRNRDRMKVARILGVSLTMIDAEGKLI